MLDSVYAQRSTKEVERIQALYDYTRNQKIAEKEKEKASRRLFFIFILVGTVLFLLALSVIAIFKYREIKQKRQVLEEKYQQSLDSIQKAQKDLSSLKRYQEQNQELILEKEKLIREQEIVRNTMLQNEKTIRDAAQRQFNSSAICKRITKLADAGGKPTKSEWQELQDALFGLYPNFSELMTRHSQDLDDREYKVCILIRAGISPGAIAAMLGILSSIVTKLRVNLLLKLFRIQGTSKEFDTILRRIY
jgi:CHASE3 domain sensor protein